MLNFVTFFFCISCDDHIIFTIGLNMLYLLCILGISKAWSWYTMWCWNQFAILLRIFASILVKDFDLYFSYHDNLLIFLWGFPCIWSASLLWLPCNFSLCLWFLTVLLKYVLEKVSLNLFRDLWTSSTWISKSFYRFGRFLATISLNKLSFPFLHLFSLWDFSNSQIVSLFCRPQSHSSVFFFFLLL